MSKKKEQFEQPYLPSDILSDQGHPKDVEVNPTATNDMEAEELFIERKEYKEFAYPYEDEAVPTPIDIWYNRGLYGKVDTHYNPVFVDEKFLKKLPSQNKDDTFALNFVVDAFSDLQNYMHVAANTGKIFTTDTKFLALNPKQGWTSVQNRYFEHISSIYEGFANTFLEQGKNKKELITFKDFMKLFQSYLETIEPTFPFTRTGYIISGFCPVTTTGIVVELEEGNQGDDEVKYDDYISDKNFVFYTRAARKFGFWVDKNAPWRLVADLKSEVMQKYMSRYPEAPPEPPLSGSRPQRPDPCAPEWFGSYFNQKVNFTPDKIGYISSLVDCPAAGGAHEATRFRIQEVTEDIEIEIIQSLDLVIPSIDFEGPASAVGPAGIQGKNKAQIIGVAAPDPSHVGESEAIGTVKKGQLPTYSENNLDKFRWIVAPLLETTPSTRESVSKYYVNPLSGVQLRIADRVTGLGAWKPQPIALDGSKSKINGDVSEVLYWNWKLVGFPQGASQQFFESNGDPANSTMNRSIPKIWFKPDQEGEYIFELTVTDKDGNTREEKAFATLSVCMLDWEDTANSFVMDTDFAAEAFGPAWIYSKLKSEVEAVWEEWNDRSHLETSNWLGVMRHDGLESISGIPKNQMPAGLGYRCKPLGIGFQNRTRQVTPLTTPGDRLPFPFPFKMQFPTAATIREARPHTRDITIITPNASGVRCDSRQEEQLPLNGEAEFLRTRMGWDIIGKHKILTNWIKYVCFDKNGARRWTNANGRPATPRGLGEPPPGQRRRIGLGRGEPLSGVRHSWGQILLRAEIGPDRWQPGNILQPGQWHMWQTLNSDHTTARNDHVYNQWQARSDSDPQLRRGVQNGGRNGSYGHYETGRTKQFYFPRSGNPMFLCERKIERYVWSLAPLPWRPSSPTPTKIFPWRPPTYYRVPTRTNIGSLNNWEKGLPDDEMWDGFGGASADLFEIMILISRQLCAGVSPLYFMPNTFIRPNLSHPSENRYSQWKAPEMHAYAREPFSGMGIVPFYWFDPEGKAAANLYEDHWWGGRSDEWASFPQPSYRSDWVITKFDFVAGYNRARRNRQWNDPNVGNNATSLDGDWAPYEWWRRNCYIGNSRDPHMDMFVQDPRFKDTLKPWSTSALSNLVRTNSAEAKPIEMDEIIRYLIAIGPSDTNFGDIIAFVLIQAAQQGCPGLVDVPANPARIEPDTPEPTLDSFETHPIFVNTPIPLPLMRGWSLAHGSIEEYTSKRLEYSHRLIDHARLLREWQLRKEEYEAWLLAMEEWRRTPKLSFDNLYLHNPPGYRSPGEYIKSFEEDIEILQTYILNFYNSYVSQNQIIVDADFNECGDGTVQHVKRRKLLEWEDFQNKYNDVFWLRFYFELRLAESDRQLTKHEIRAKMKRIENLYYQSSVSGTSNKKLKALQKIAFETNGIFEDKTELTVQRKHDKILNNFKQITKNDSLTLSELYDIVLPDGSFKP